MQHVSAQGKWAGRNGDKRAGTWKGISEHASGRKKRAPGATGAQRINVSEDFFAARRLAFAASPILLSLRLRAIGQGMVRGDGQEMVGRWSGGGQGVQLTIVWSARR